MFTAPPFNLKFHLTLFRVTFHEYKQLAFIGKGINMNIFLVVARFGEKPSPLLFQQMPGKRRGAYVGPFFNHVLVVNRKIF